MNWATLHGKKQRELKRTIELKGATVYLSRSMAGTHAIEIINKQTDAIHFGVGDSWQEAKDMLVFFGSSLAIKKENE